MEQVKKIFMKEHHAHISFVGTGSVICRGSPTCFTERRKAKNEVVDIAVKDEGGGGLKRGLFPMYSFHGRREK